MPHSFGLVYVHAVLGTRDGRPFLAEVGLRADVHGYVMGILRKLGCQGLRAGGVEDHVHALFRLSRVETIAKVVEEVQRGSSTWIRNQGITDFDWRKGYAAFSVSDQNAERVIRYLDSQERRHRELSFAEEYRGFLRKCGGREHEINVHLVFSTKNRIPFLADDALRERLHQRLAEICEIAGSPSLAIGGIEDHVHLLCRLAPDQTLARFAQELKKGSSTWLSTRQHIEGFGWQVGYGAFSVSPEHLPAVTRYIQNQQEHHRHETFQDECRRFARPHKGRAGGKPHSPG
jgi:REP-associated tyrosine transposase